MSDIFHPQNLICKKICTFSRKLGTEVQRENYPDRRSAILRVNPVMSRRHGVLLHGLVSRIFLGGFANILDFHGAKNHTVLRDDLQLLLDVWEFRVLYDSGCHCGGGPKPDGFCGWVVPEYGLISVFCRCVRRVLNISRKTECGRRGKSWGHWNSQISHVFPLPTNF